jgi:hypothetical protein
MRHRVAEDECVDVLRSECLALDAGNAVHDAAERFGFLVGQVTELADMPLRLDDQPASIRRRTAQRVRVTDVHESVLVDHPAFRGVAQPVLVADEAVSA